LDPKNSDYSAILTKIKSMGADGLFFGGAGLAGVKLMKQCFDILPDLKKAGGDGIAAADLLQGAGFPACQGWYATVPAPDMLGDSKMQSWISAFKTKYNEAPDNFSITSYAAAQVLTQAIASVASTGQAVTRDLVRDAIQRGKFSTLQGDVAFDENGDIQSKVISVYQIQKDDGAPLDDVSRQYKYLGVAPVI
jgi:branched-chain amino acid transport system substrate-binding protein